MSDASLVAGDFIFSGFTTGGANAAAAGFSTGSSADDDVVRLTLAATITAGETGAVRFTAAGVAEDASANTNTQTGNVSVTDGIPPAPAVTGVVTGDADSDGQIDRVAITFSRAVDVADGVAGDGFGPVTVAGYTIANAD